MRTVALGEVATIDRKSVQPDDLNRDAWYLGLEHIERGGRIIGCDTVESASVSSTKFSFSPNHVLFGKLRPNLGKIARPDFGGVCSTDILPIRPGCQVDRSYLAHYLARPDVVEFAAARATGANLPRLNPKVLERFPVPLPDIAEQRRVAAILDHADALRAKRRQVLAHLDDLTQSIFHDMFGRIDWPTSCLNDLTTVSGEYGANVPSVDLAADLPRYIRITDVDEAGRLRGEGRSPGGTASDWERYRLEDGDLLFARSGATVGKAYRHQAETGPSVFAGYFIRFRPDPSVLHPDFLFGFTRTAFYRAWVGARQNVVAQPNINAKQYGRELSVPVPPLRLQEQFARRVQLIHKQCGEVSRALAVDDELFASLQSRAFRGEL